MNIQFLEPLADANDYPTPKIKGLPSLKIYNFNFFVRSINKEIISTGVFTQNARNGLALIGQQIKLHKGHSILLPAYHCPALVEPFIWLGVKIQFYKLNKDLSVDLDDFKNKINDTTKACLIVRFFGFSTNQLEVSKIAKNNSLIIIEDWAHCFFGQLNTIKKTNTRDFAVASCNKFFPSVNGGLVWGLAPVQSDIKSVSWKNEIKSFINTFNFLDKTLSLFKNLFSIKAISISKPLINNSTLEKNNSFRYFVPATINDSCLRLTRWIVRHSNYDKIIKHRQSNFRYLLNNLSDTTIGKPLYTSLPDKTVPYVFPFFLNNPEHFNDIKNAGLGLFRWEELSESDCTTSKSYREHLIQLPCHQDLTQEDLENIVKIMKNLLP